MTKIIIMKIVFLCQIGGGGGGGGGGDGGGGGGGGGSKLNIIMSRPS